MFSMDILGAHAHKTDSVNIFATVLCVEKWKECHVFGLVTTEHYEAISVNPSISAACCSFCRVGGNVGGGGESQLCCKKINSENSQT